MLSAVNWVVPMAEMMVESTDEVMDDPWAVKKAVKMAVNLVDSLGVRTVVDLVDSMVEKMAV